MAVQPLPVCAGATNPALAFGAAKNSLLKKRGFIIWAMPSYQSIRPTPNDCQLYIRRGWKAWAFDGL